MHIFLPGKGEQILPCKSFSHFFSAVLSVFAYTFEYFTSHYIKMSLVLNNWTLVKTIFNSLKVGSWGFECIIILLI